MRFAARLACAAVSAMPLVTAAQGTAEWKFQAALYGYLPGVSGKTSFPASGGGNIDIDAAKILEGLDFTLMGAFEASKGPWGVFTDVIYLDVGDSVSESRDIAIGGVLPAGTFASIRYDLKAWVWTVAGFRRAVDTPAHKLDLVGGVRLLDAKQALEWTLTGDVGSIALPDRAGSRKASVSNWDVIVGIKGRASFGESARWFMPYYLDIGAGQSSFTWQAMAGVGYSFGWGDVVGAWRYLDYSMKSGKPIESVGFSGPAIAAVLRW